MSNIVYHLLFLAQTYFINLRINLIAVFLSSCNKLAKIWSITPDLMVACKFSCKYYFPIITSKL